MVKKVIGLTGWGMLPGVGPAHDFNGVLLTAVMPWPGYVSSVQNSLAESWTTASLLEWLDQQIQQIGGGEPVALVGWSMGGLLALCYADRFPDRVAQLSLWASTACFLEKENWPGQTKAAVDALRQGLHHKDKRVLERFFKSQIPLTPEYRKVRRTWQDQVDAVGLPQWEALSVSLEWLVSTDIRERLSHIQTPTEVHHGVEDAIIPVEAGRHLANVLPKAQWYPHVGCGHAVWLKPV